MSRMFPTPLEVSLAPESSFEAGKKPEFAEEISVDGSKLTISFKRTIRVPDDGKDHKLPPDLGNFPLLNVESFERYVPPQMRAQGRVFLPVYRKSKTPGETFSPHCGPINAFHFLGPFAF